MYISNTGTTLYKGKLFFRRSEQFKGNNSEQCNVRHQYVYRNKNICNVKLMNRKSYNVRDVHVF